MPIELPRFEGEYGLMLTVCGKLKTIDPEVQSETPRKVPVASYESPAGKVFIRVSLTGKKEKHLHVDCAVEKLFSSKTPKPKVTHEKDDILKIIESVSGKEIDCHIEAHFDIPILDLPESGLIRSLCVEQRSADLSMQLTGGVLSLTGAPVRRIRWNMLKKHEKSTVHVCIDGERSMLISERYLSESWEWINEQFSIFVLGRRKNA
jgi:hypothetical protein